VPRRASRSAMSVAGRPGPGTQRARTAGWKNRLIACCTVVTVLPTVSADPCSAGLLGRRHRRFPLLAGPCRSGRMIARVRSQPGLAQDLRGLAAGRHAAASVAGAVVAPEQHAAGAGDHERRQLGDGHAAVDRGRPGHPGSQLGRETGPGGDRPAAPPGLADRVAAVRPHPASPDQRRGGAQSDQRGQRGQPEHHQGAGERDEGDLGAAGHWLRVAALLRARHRRPTSRPPVNGPLSCKILLSIGAPFGRTGGTAKSATGGVGCR